VSSPPRPVPDPDVSGVPFWEAAARHELVIQKCASCGVLRHPPRPMCPACNSMDYTFEQASGRGHIWSWVIAHAPVLPSFAEKVPYNVIVVELEEGVRMIGNLLDLDNDAIEEGMQVTVDFEDIEEGVSLPVWRPA
jgi:uncharacterized protein